MLSYLASRDELKRSQGRLEVWDVGLEFIEGGCDAGLQLGRMLPRGAVGSDLVESWLRHDGRLEVVNSSQSQIVSRFEGWLVGLCWRGVDLEILVAQMKTPK